MKVWPMFKKELRLYFTLPVAWIVIAIFTLIAGAFFSAMFTFFARASANPQMAGQLNFSESVLRPFFGNLSVIQLFFMPFLTMRLFAEERRSGTIELLLTYPIRDGAVLLGKYLAVLALFAIMLAPTLLFPAIARYFGPLEWGPVLTGYLGLFLMGGMFLAVGMLASSLTENQIIAAATSFGALLIFWIFAWFADSVTPTVGAVLRHLSILEHNDNFSRGVLDTKDVVYYLNFTLILLFLTLRAIETRRWRG